MNQELFPAIASTIYFLKAIASTVSLDLWGDRDVLDVEGAIACVVNGENMDDWGDRFVIEIKGDLLQQIPIKPATNLVS